MSDQHHIATATGNSTSATLRRIDALLDRHDRQPPRRTNGAHVELLSRAVLRKQLTYPRGRTPQSCIDDGTALLRALAAGDGPTVARLGIRARSDGKGAVDGLERFKSAMRREA
jgi:hypothetical protein